MSRHNENGDAMHLPGQQLPAVQNTGQIQQYDYAQHNSQDDDDDEIDLRELWQVIMRRKWLIMTIALLVFMVSLISTLMMKPTYRASATLQLNPEQSQVLEYDVETGAQKVGGRDFYETQYELLKSRMLANRVIDELGIESQFKGEELAKPFFADMLDELRSLFNSTLAAEAEGTAETSVTTETVDSKSLLGEQPLADKLLANLSIQPVKNSQIVTVHYTDTNPERAATITNTVIDNFVEVNLERRRDAATYAEKFLTEELVTAKSRLLESETQLNAYAKERGIITTDDKESLTSQKLRGLSEALTAAESDRIKAESEFVKSSQSDGASTALENSAIQAMKKNLAELESQYKARLQSSSSFEDGNIRALKQRLAQLESEYQAEITSSRALDNPVIRSMKQQLATLQSQYKAEMSSSGSFDNPAIQTMKQRLAQLQTELQGGSGGNTIQNATTQNLTQQIANLESQYQEKLQVYKPAYPLMVQLRQKINEIKQQINQENQSQRSNLTQQINQLKQEINQETRALSTNTRTNLNQQIQQLQADIARETQTVGTGTRAYLKKQIDQLKIEIARETSASDNNARTSLLQQINELKVQIAKESGNINNTVAADLKAKFAAAQDREAALRAEFENQKAELVTLRDKNVGLGELQREVESNRNIYEGLLNRQKEIGVAGGIGSNNISVVDAAVVPFRVYKPNLRLNLMLGAVLGTFLGLVLAFLLEFMDDRVKSAEELDHLVKLPTLGIIPKSKQKDPIKLALMTQSEPRSAFAEAYRSLRTNLMFSTQQGTPGVLAITSAAATEGKSTSAINIATVFAQSGKTVLLVDTDLRNPSVHKRLQLDNTKGLTNYLTGQDHIESVTQSCQIPGVYVITAGPMSPNPVELLASERLDQLLSMAKTETFDMIIMDMPPVLGLADALVIASRADATIMSVAMNESKKQAVSGALKRLRHARSNVIGTIAAKTKQGSGYGYNYNYDYYSYGTDKKALDAA